MPEFLDESEVLIRCLRRMSRRALSELMGISEDLAKLNHQRYASWERPFTIKNAKQAVFAFNGPVYTGLDAHTFRPRDLSFAQDHLRILSGLHGILRPLDLIQPYRLEMGTRLSTRRGRSLYDFWGEAITDSINTALAGQEVLVNLASNEYFKSVKPRRLTGSVVVPLFKEIKDGKSRTIATFAKRARGQMASWIVRNRIDTPDELTHFDADGYAFVPSESTDQTLVFARPQPAPVGV